MSRPETQRIGDAAGFTVVDMAMTVAVLGVVLGFGISIVDTTVWKLDTSASQVAQRTRMARSLAVLRQHDVIVSFDVTEKALFVHEDADNDGVRDDGERRIRYSLEKGISYTRGAAPAYGGFSSGGVTFTDSRITFRRNGSTSEEGAIYVGRGSDDERPKAVIVRRATGYTEILKYDGSDWVKP